MLSDDELLMILIKRILTKTHVKCISYIVFFVAKLHTHHPHKKLKKTTKKIKLYYHKR